MKDDETPIEQVHPSVRVAVAELRAMERSRRAEQVLMDRDDYRRAHYAMHVLWTKAAHQDDYDKEQWKELEAAIGALARGGS